MLTGEQETADRLQRHSHMVACLHMAMTYLNIADAEIGLYRKTRGCLPLDFDLNKLRERIRTLIAHHRAEYDPVHRQLPPLKNKAKLKKRALD